MNKPAFEVDKIGLAKLLTRRGKHFAVLELVQNAFDEDVREVKVRLDSTDTRGRWRLVVEDDCPTGFSDLSHAYTLFAESAKKAEPTQRGRFNLGEKLVIALCEHATIVTTTGAIEWNGNGRRSLRRRTEKGSVFTGEMRMSGSESAETVKAIKSVIVPINIQLSLHVNGDRVELGRHLHLSTFEETLPTERSDEEGYLRPTKRKTEIEVYEPRDGEVATLYEMGIPVVETGDTWHVNIGQKVPLNTDRDNVRPSYLKKVRTFVLNAMSQDLPKEAATAAWVSEALGSKDVEDWAVGAVLDHRYGDKRVISDPSDPEANKLAVSKGYAVIQAGSMNRDQWDSVRRSGAAFPAGKVTPSPKPWSLDPSASTAEDIPEEEWTKGMTRIEGFSRDLAEGLGIGRVFVGFVNVPNGFAAAFGAGHLTFNIRRLGKRWFDKSPTSEAVLELLIHEFGHHFSGDHLSEDYHDGLSTLGARLGRLALRDPDFFEKWNF